MARSSEPSLFAVLVVDDEPLLLMDAVDLIEDAGFTAYGASNADVAIRILEGQSDIRVLFTDVDMPGSMDGLKLAHAVRQHWPSVAIIVTSGHVRPAQGELPANGIFFPKPYPPQGMIAALQDIAAHVETCGIAAPPSHPELSDYVLDTAPIPLLAGPRTHVQRRTCREASGTCHGGHPEAVTPSLRRASVGRPRTRRTGPRGNSRRL